jgi:hypothetical protein
MWSDRSEEIHEEYCDLLLAAGKFQDDHSGNPCGNEIVPERKAILLD